MIGKSTPEYVFIRACIFFLHWLAPFCLLYCFVLFPARPRIFPVPVALEAWIALETAFFLLIWLPRKRYLQAAAVHPEPVPRDRRRLLFERCMSHIPDPERYMSKWFMDSPASDIKRDNAKDFLRWAFLNTGEVRAEDEEELDEYIDATEKLLGRKFEPGRGKAKCLRLTLDEVDMLHRSVLWYLCVFVVDMIASAHLYYLKFDYHRTPLRRFFAVFPFRPHNLLAKSQSSSKTLTYWHRPHTSKTRLPILFIHGIGIGLYPYTNFLAEINGDNGGNAEDDGELGIIAVEIMPVSFRITGQALQKDEMCAEINSILKAHGWDRFILVSHSYGSVISTHLLHTPHIAQKIGPILFVDPVSILLHLPDVAYNFICRKPVHANEHQLYYFASKDMGVAHTLSRRFFWNENILWKEDMSSRPVTAILSGKDLIVDTRSVGEYLADADAASREKGTWKTRPWTGKGVEVMWFDELDHAQVFDKRSNRARLINILREYSHSV